METITREELDKIKSVHEDCENGSLGAFDFMDVVLELTPSLIAAAEEGLRVPALEKEKEGAWKNRDVFCQHINIIGHEALGFTVDNCSPEAVSRETKILVQSLRDRVKELEGLVFSLEQRASEADLYEEEAQ